MPKTLFDLPTPAVGKTLKLGQLYGSSRSLLLAERIATFRGLSVVVCSDMADVEQIEQELLFFSHQAPEIVHFPDLETLPYDLFSPHQDIISERIKCLATLSSLKRGLLILPITTILQKVAPSTFIYQRSLNLKSGDIIEPAELREKLINYGYRNVSQVEEHGEFAVRGSILDLYPMGSKKPFRVEFFDDEIETIRSFDAESQRSLEKLNEINLLPAQEFPLDSNGIKTFRQNFRERFDIDPNSCPLYTDISQGISSPGIEYYLPLFFNQLSSLFDYLPESTQVLIDQAALNHSKEFLDHVGARYESRRHNLERPLLEPDKLYLNNTEFDHYLAKYPYTVYNSYKYDACDAQTINCNTQAIPQLTIQSHSEQPDQALQKFINKKAFEKIL
ncbi:MAG: transcription-repair coupling factor, partial [Gammaproteobacteria bacterium]|nr:transcription-repair coupling factor [Gammaproteobacteria bacterium]